MLTPSSDVRAALLVVLSAAGLAVLGGCSTTQARPDWLRKLTFWEEMEVDPRGVQAPYQRIVEMRAQAKNIPSLGREAQHAEACKLAETFRNEPDPLVRMQLVRTIAHCASPAAGETLQTALGDSEPDVRAVACEAWGMHGGPQAVPLLSETLRKDTSPDVRMAAARALGNLPGPDVVQALAPMLEDPNPAMQYRAVQSLRQATGKDFGNDVNAWRTFVQGGSPPEISTAARWKLDWF